MHDLRADIFKRMLHLKIIEYGILRQNLFQQLSEFGDIPLPVAKVIDQCTFRVFLGDAEIFVKRRVGADHLMTGIQYQKGFTHRSQDIVKYVYKRFLHFQILS
jgi:hypothetical protein